MAQNRQTSDIWAQPGNLKIVLNALRERARLLGREAREAAQTSYLREGRLRAEWRATRTLVNAAKSQLSSI